MHNNIIYHDMMSQIKWINVCSSLANIATMLHILGHPEFVFKAGLLSSILVVTFKGQVKYMRDCGLYFNLWLSLQIQNLTYWKNNIVKLFWLTRFDWNNFISGNQGYALYMRIIFTLKFNRNNEWVLKPQNMSLQIFRISLRH